MIMAKATHAAHHADITMTALAEAMEIIHAGTAAAINFQLKRAAVPVALF